VVLDRDGMLGLDDLPEGDPIRQAPAAAGSGGTSHLIGQPLEAVERYYIEQALELTGGNREEASRMLGIGERTLYRKIKQWGLDAKKRTTKVGKD
jgi:two-component system response regulator HydG